MGFYSYTFGGKKDEIRNCYTNDETRDFFALLPDTPPIEIVFYDGYGNFHCKRYGIVTDMQYYYF